MIEPVGGHGGMDYYDYGLCEALVTAGVGVVLHTCDETLLHRKAGLDVRHTYRGVFGGSAAPLRGLRFLAGSIKALVFAVRENIKIVHLHYFRVGILALLNVLMARIALRKVVITAHDVESFVSSLEVPLMSRMAYRLAHRIIAHNQVSRTELINRLKVQADKISVIPHGNYLHALRPLMTRDASRDMLGIPRDAKVLLFFGQIKTVKGLDILLKAMPAVLERHPETVLLIAGKPWKTDFTEYRSLIDLLGIGHACKSHIRYIHADEAAYYYGAADIVVLPYQRIYQSGVALMAMSYGKPVIVSDLPGMVEMITDGEDGFVFHRGDSQSLAIRLNEVLAAPDLMTLVAMRGREMVEKRYGWDAIGRHTANLYADIGAGN
jgi:glycosyltransferase involved in cell wall biosynthesis